MHKIMLLFCIIRCIINKRPLDMAFICGNKFENMNHILHNPQNYLPL